eukprot:TRINITY_DN7160_c0_g5_i1.p1 TRINITY_DN7160_c0_g5~~TRINITY_DN7160_c0_g5_i1.p1  ORF type:complete len:488 (+),score=7.32 TRINITY_DN7160_c0_g5_i1:131-1594(+)
MKYAVHTFLKWLFVSVNVVAALFLTARAALHPEGNVVIVDELGLKALSTDGQYETKTPEKWKKAVDRIAAWRAGYTNLKTFKKIDPVLVDPSYVFNGECKWFFTSDCTPYGRLESRTQSCQDPIPSMSSGFCQCRDGQLFGKPCTSKDQFVVCSDICSVPPAKFPSYSDLMRYNTALKLPAVIASFSTTKRYARLCRTLHSLRQAFNHNKQYPIVVVHEPHDTFTESYKRGVSGTSPSTTVHFINASPEYWSVPRNINTTRIVLYKHKNIPGMDSLFYRQAARYVTGYMHQESIFEAFEYIMLVEDAVMFLCKIHFDPFLLMRVENKSVGFSMMYHDFPTAMPSVDDRIAEAFDPKGSSGVEDYHLPYLLSGGYSGCVFGPAYLFLSLSFMRSQGFTSTFSYLDRSGGFFYERWSQPAVFTLLTTSLLPSSQLYYFEGIGVANPDAYHVPNDTYVCKGEPVPPRNSPGSNDWRHPCMQDFAPLAELH